MKIIGYDIEDRLVYREVKQLEIIPFSTTEENQYYKIRACFRNYANEWFFIERVAGDEYVSFKSKKEANEVLSKILSLAIEGTIDLRGTSLKMDRIVGFTPSVRVRNENDVITEEKEPLTVTLDKESIKVLEDLLSKRDE